jgi:drug/metabolite transporter (DMT)-like permease
MAFAGCAAIVIGAYCAAQASVLIKAKGAGIHPAALSFCQMLCGLPPIIAYSLLREGNPLTFNWSWRAFGCVLYLTVFGTVAAFWLYYWLLHRVESTKAMMIALVTPLNAVVIGWLAIGERLPPLTFFGGALIVASVGLIVFRRKRIGPQRRGDAEEIQIG